MPEYTVLASVFVVVVVIADIVLNTGLMTNWRYWLFIMVMFGFTCIVNGYLTWRPVVLYHERMNLGVRLVTIPIEDFLFGFSLLTSTIIVWEFAGSREKRNSGS